MQQIVDFFLGIGFSLILTSIYILLRYRVKGFKKWGLYFYNIVTFGIIKTINSKILLPVFGCGCVPMDSKIC